MSRIGAILIVAAAVMLAASAGAADIPMEVGGIRLGAKLTDIKDKIKPDTTLPVRHHESVREVEIIPQPGIKSGMILYCTCMQPERIGRIVIKTADSSKKLYEELLERYKVKFGKPNEFKGDSFGLVKAWKWYFTGKDGTQVSLILQHNLSDEDTRMGNSIKLTLSTLMEKEYNCFDKKQAGKGAHMQAKQRGMVNWDLLIPK